MQQRELILNYCSDNNLDINKVSDYINSALNNDNYRFELGIDDDFLGFIETYELISKILREKHNSNQFIIVDVGYGGFGLQQIFFHWASKYIGIDRPNKLFRQKRLLDNVSFIDNFFLDVPRDSYFFNNGSSVGVANMSFLYSKDKEVNLKYFNEVFEKKIVL